MKMTSTRRAFLTGLTTIPGLGWAAAKAAPVMASRPLASREEFKSIVFHLPSEMTELNEISTIVSGSLPSNMKLYSVEGKRVFPSYKRSGNALYVSSERYCVAVNEDPAKMGAMRYSGDLGGEGSQHWYLEIDRQNKWHAWMCFKDGPRGEGGKYIGWRTNRGLLRTPPDATSIPPVDFNAKFDAVMQG